LTCAFSINEISAGEAWVPLRLAIASTTSSA
jgi:hypothetical protein